MKKLGVLLCILVAMLGSLSIATAAGDLTADEPDDGYIGITFSANQEVTCWETRVPAEYEAELRELWWELENAYANYDIRWEGDTISMALGVKGQWGDYYDDYPMEGYFGRFAVHFCDFPITIPEGAYPMRMNDETWRAKPGEMINLQMDRSARGDGYYLVGMKSDDVTLEDWQDSYSFIMPAKPVTIEPVLEKQKPIVIDLSGGGYEYNGDEDLIICLWQTFDTGISTGPFIDLNGDRIDDIIINTTKGLIQPLENYSCPAEYRLPEGNNIWVYYPITVLYDPSKETEPTPTVTPGPTPTEVPTEAPAETKEKKDIGPIWFYIGGAAVLLSAAGLVVVLISRKKRK